MKRGGFFSKKELAAICKINLFSALLPGIVHSIGALSVRNPSSTKYTYYFFAIKLNGDKFTQLFSKGHCLI